jgi:VWFA-related protein
MTRTNLKWPFAIFVICVVLVPPPWRVSPQAQQPAAAQPPTQAQQKPVFRAGTHFVRVDAYPTSKDGRIIEGLKPEDFDVTEDGKPQAIESFDYISFPTFTPDAERHDPESQRAGFDMAADPRYRVFVILIDMKFGGTHAGAVVETKGDLAYMQSPLVNFLDRMLGPQDLFGFLTSRQTAKDLVLGQRSVSVKAQIGELFRASMVDIDEADELEQCPRGALLKERFRLDQTYTALEGLVTQLGSLRDERKNIIFVTNRLPRPQGDKALLDATGGAMPRAGIVGGRVGIGDHVIGANDSFCAGEVQRLSMMDFDFRYRDLLRSARKENVTFYTITPAGLQAPVTQGQLEAVKRDNDDLITLAHETDGIAIVDTNDLSGGMKKIADDLAAYYVLGYYTTNTKWDGGVRTIKVRLKPSGQTIRARRQYRAPTEAEIASLASRSAPAAGAPVSSGPATLIGEPVAYRIVLRQAPEKSPRLEFTRSDRLRVEWPVLGALDRREARLLDSSGKPLPIDVPLSENEGAKTLVAELPLAPFAKGVYSIELTAGAGGKTEQRRLTFTLK